jgi:hypothetical protein
VSWPRGQWIELWGTILRDGASVLWLGALVYVSCVHL